MVICFSTGLYNFTFAQKDADTPDTVQIASKIALAEKLSSDSAIFIYNQVITITSEYLEGANEPKVKETLLKQLIRAYLNLGLEFFYSLNYDKAQEQNMLALRLSGQLNDPFFFGECYFYIAEVNLEQSQFGSAMENYRTALEYYKKANNKSNEFWCYTGMGIVQKQVGNLQEAIVQYNHALNTAKSSGLKKEEAACWNNLGNVYRRQGDFTKAMESYQMAITVLQELKDDDAVSDCLNNIGNLYLDNGDPFRALDYYKQALITAEAKNDEYRLIIRYKNLAGAYSELKDYENATQYLNDAISLAEKSGDKSFIASCNMLFGKLQYTRGDLRIAIAYYEKSVGLYNETGAKDEEAEALVELALARLEAGEVRQALADGHQAAKLAVLTGSLKNRMAASLCLAKCYEVSGDPREAYNYLSQATRLKDSIYSIEKYRTIEEIEANFKQSEVKKENEILIQNNLLQQQAMRTKNLVLTLLCISLVLSAIIIRMIYKRQMQTKRDASRMKQVSDQRIEKLNEDLTTKVRELTSKTIFINQKNQLLEKLIAELDDIKDNDITAASIQQLQTRLKHELSPNAWKEFEVQFNEVHPGFQQRLLEKFPDLTPAERRLCSFIRLDMNTREISSLSGQSTKSIEVARSRIRKKLSISREQNLTNAIALI